MSLAWATHRDSASGNKTILFFTVWAFSPSEFIRSARVGDMSKSLESGWKDRVINGEERHE